MTLTLAHAADAVAWLRRRLGDGDGSLRIDSRQVRPGDAFIAWPGQATDGRQHVAAALAAGAAACLVEADGVAAFGFDAADVRIAALPGLKAATGPIAAEWHGHPTRQLAVVAVTATNGKSSTAWWTAQALTALGRRCGLVGTLGIGEPPAAVSTIHEPPAAVSATIAPPTAGTIVPTGLTTPDPVTLQAALRRMVDDGFAACAVEASSIGIVEHRLAGASVRVAQFINFTRDHLDYHGSMPAYWAAKRQLFSWPGLAAAVVDIDDAHGAELAAELQSATGLDLWTCARRAAGARLRAEGVHYVVRGLAFTVVERTAHGDSLSAEVATTLVGEHNVHNLLAVLGALRALGLPLAQAAAVAPGLTPVPGRMQPVPAPAGLAGPEVVVDYAHTPDALEKALAALQPMAIARGGRLWCVFGCGGNRDATKRPLMGAIAGRMADRVVLTSDNPRDEDPAQILAQIAVGLDLRTAVEVIADRGEAIAHAVSNADPVDVVLLAGKGHEDYQEVRGQRRPFLDLAVAAAALQRRGAA
jgi:UDP-N-acetylmuramyl-tripeptide synthetase